jgi:molybdopterin synthase catalytic subunit
MFEARITAEVFDVGAEVARLQALGPEVGAIATFVGQVRGPGLYLEHYPAMAGPALRALVEAARARWPIDGAIIIHRYGGLEAGAPIVLVATASRHRHAALESCAWAIDRLKVDAPFWKKESDGWVEAAAADGAAAGRWDAVSPGPCRPPSG